MSIAKSTQPTSIGGLYVDPSHEPGLFPLQHTTVIARIAGNLARVRVRQTFANQSDRSLEATYVFPLPCKAAVDRFEVCIGHRTIAGRIETRETAYQIYQQAKHAGRTAGLLEQERDNLFTQSITHIQPGEHIEIHLCYTELLPWDGGEGEFVFPTAIGPRYIPGKSIASGTLDTDLVPDASRICPPLLPVDTPSGTRLDLDLEIDAGFPIEEVRSPSHEIEMDWEGDRVWVRLAAGDTLPNRELVIHYRVANPHTQMTVFTQADERGGHFALYGIPALTYNREEIFPKDVVFLVDTSGSQMGDPLAKSKELMCRFIRGLNPEDTFTIINFADTAKQLSLVPLANTPLNCDRAIEYIQNLHAYGGTRMLGGIRAAIEFREPPPGRLRSVVMLTDGYIGNECAILAEVQSQLQPGNRLHAFGVGSSVNRFLIEGLARVGRGISRVVHPDEPTEAVAEEFFRQINNPVLRDIEVTWVGEGENPDIYPTVIPDLFDRQPLTLFGRKTDRRSGTLQITGVTARGDRYERRIPIDFETGGNEAIAQLWGRSRIEYLSDRMLDYEKKSYVDAVTQTALSYQLLSGYTAFVATSEEVRVDAPHDRISITVPVALPEGLRYEGLFGMSEAAAILGGLRGSPNLDPIQTPATSPSTGNRRCRSVRRGAKRTDKPPLFKPPPSRARVFPPPASLEFTPWERCVLEPLLEGLTNGEIAHRLNRSIRQIDREVRHLLAKTGTRSRAQLIRDLCRGGRSPVRSSSENSLPSSAMSKSAIQFSPDLRDASNTRSNWNGRYFTKLNTTASRDIALVEISGLGETASHQLTQSLRRLDLRATTAGQMTFEAIVQNGRVLRVVWDDKASTLEDPRAIDSIRAFLQRWPISIDSGRIRIALRWI